MEFGSLLDFILGGFGRSWELLGVSYGASWASLERLFFDLVSFFFVSCVSKTFLDPFWIPKWGKLATFRILAPKVRKSVPETFCLISFLGQGAKWIKKCEFGPKSTFWEVPSLRLEPVDLVNEHVLPKVKR